jgi:hypothetical protein
MNRHVVKISPPNTQFADIVKISPPSTQFPKGLDPKIWGSPAWKFIRSVVIGWDFEKQDPKKLSDFINLLPHVLPCEKCRLNFTKVLQKYPGEPYIARREMSKWFNEVREMVRQHEDTQQSKIENYHLLNDLPFEEGQPKSFLAKYNKWFMVAAFVMIGGGIIYYMYQKRKKLQLLAPTHSFLV